MSIINKHHPAHGILFGTSDDATLPTGGKTSSGMYATVQPSSIPGFVLKTCNNPTVDGYPLWVLHVMSRNCSGPHDPRIQAVYIDPDKGTFSCLIEELQEQSGNDFDKLRTVGFVNTCLYEMLAKVGAEGIFADLAYLQMRFDTEVHCDLHRGNWMEDSTGRKIATDPITISGRYSWEQLVAAFEGLADRTNNRVFIAKEEPKPQDVPASRFHADHFNPFDLGA